jgi:hypothetical protein
MHTLAFMCPKTDEKLSTQILMDVQSYEKLQAETLPMLCPHCGAKHRFRVSECVVADEEVPTWRT